MPREQDLILDKDFQPVFIFLAGKTREFRVPSLCLHVFPTAALTSSNALRCLTNSSLGPKCRGKNPEGPSRDLRCRFKRRETENVCNYLALLCFAISEEQNHQEKRKNVGTGFGFHPCHFLHQPGIHCEQKLHFGHIAIHPSDVSRCSLAAAGGSSAAVVGYPACQSNVRPVC